MNILVRAQFLGNSRSDYIDRLGKPGGFCKERACRYAKPCTERVGAATYFDARGSCSASWSTPTRSPEDLADDARAHGTVNCHPLNENLDAKNAAPALHSASFAHRESPSHSVPLLFTLL